MFKTLKCRNGDPYPPWEKRVNLNYNMNLNMASIIKNNLIIIITTRMMRKIIDLIRSKGGKRV